MSFSDLLEEAEKDIHNYVIVLDVETGSFGKTQDIVQLSYIIYDGETIVKKVNSYITNRVVMPEAQSLHGITTKYLTKHGVEFDGVIKQLVDDVRTCSTLVGHNIGSDIRHIRENIVKYKIDTDPEVFANLFVYDTMREGKMFANTKNKNGLLKFPKLCELYCKIFDEEMENAHDALQDCICTAKCYFVLKKMED